MSSLVPSGPSRDDDIDTLRSRIGELERALKERAAEVTRAKTDLAAFRIRYTREVGTLHEELDDLDRAIAEAELGEMAKRLEDAHGTDTASPSNPEAAATARYTSDAVRRLFREVAKTIHPDLARDELARDRRHTLMIEANRAYALGDEERLRRILSAWENSPEAVQGTDADSERLRLQRRLSQMEEELEGWRRELVELQDAPLWKLKVMVDEAAARGKDLVADMVRRLKRDIMAARNRLDAMQWNP